MATLAELLSGAASRNPTGTPVGPVTMNDAWGSMPQGLKDQWAREHGGDPGGWENAWARLSPAAQQAYASGGNAAASGGTGGVNLTGTLGGTIDPTAMPYGPIDYSGANALGGPFSSTVFGPVPGIPAGLPPSEQLRQLLLTSLEADRSALLARDQFNEAVRAGDRDAALRAKTEADDQALRARQLDVQASQFSQTFGLQAQEQGFRQTLATAQLTGSLNGQDTLEMRQQKLAEAQYGTQLAAHPENLIQYALYQGSRTPGGLLGNGLLGALQGGASGAPGAPGVDQGVGGAGAVGAAPGATGPTQVPLPGIVQALMQRQAVPGFGVAAGGAPGQMVSLGALQNDPRLRVQAGGMDLASLGNLSGTEQGYLASVLGAQGQDVGAFTDQLKKASLGSRASAVVSGF